MDLGNKIYLYERYRRTTVTLSISKILIGDTAQPKYACCVLLIVRQSEDFQKESVDG